MKIGPLARTDFKTISPKVKLSELDDLLTSHSYLVVMDHNGFLGILSSNQGHHHPDRFVGESLSRCPQIDYHTTVDAAAHIMQQHGCVNAPVFDRNEFAGVVSLLDMVSALTDRCSDLEATLDNPAQPRAKRVARLEQEVDEYRELVSVFTHYKHSIEKILKSKSDLLADVSHEIQNPMHVILSYTKQGLLKIDKNKNELIHRYFSRINDAGEKVLLLVVDLLDLSKLESGTTQYDFKTYDLCELAEVVLEEFELILDSKQITYYLKKPDVPAVTRMDKNRILQVIRNLISNAFKFSPDESHIRLEIDMKPNELHFSIIDWGHGIPKNKLKELFTKYTRTGTPDIKGTGLGLSIAFNIINDHQGQIYATQNPEGGSIFTFTLPVIE